MRRRGTIVVGLLLLLLAAGAGLYGWATHPARRITRENAARIIPGMPREEVVDLLGPPGDYGPGIAWTYRNWIPHGVASYEEWLVDQNHIDIAFDANDCVHLIRFYDQVARPHNGWYDQVLHWLHLR